MVTKVVSRWKYRAPEAPLALRPMSKEISQSDLSDTQVIDRDLLVDMSFSYKENLLA